MTPSIAAAAFAIFAISIPFGLLPRLASLPFLARCFAAWLLTALILFSVVDQMAVLALAGLVLVVLAPVDPVKRVCFFLVTAPCLPAYLQVYLPFPGINWLIMLTYYKVVVFFVLVPLLFRLTPSEPGGGAFSLADACVVVYVALSFMLVTASVGFTAGPRFLIDQILVFAVPYFVLSRVVRSEDDLEACFRAILLAALILAFIAIIATIKQWDFYRLHEPPSASNIPDFRSGFMRISATANTHSLGYHLVIGILLLECVKKPMQLGFARLWLMRCAMFAGLLSTDSRSSLLGLIVAFMVYGILVVRKPALRWAMLLAFLVMVVNASLWIFTTDDASSVDAYDSVGYRRLLYQVSVDHILANFLLGDLHFLSNPKFTVLVQGQGIIDITSLYLQIALAFGLIGLSIFIGVFAPTMWALLRRVAGATGEAAGEWRLRASAMTLSALVGWFLLIATTSDVALTLHLGLLLIALARAIIRFEATPVEHVDTEISPWPSRGAHALRPAMARSGR